MKLGLKKKNPATPVAGAKPDVEDTAPTAPAQGAPPLQRQDGQRDLLANQKPPGAVGGRRRRRKSKKNKRGGCGCAKSLVGGRRKTRTRTRKKKKRRSRKRRR